MKRNGLGLLVALVALTISGCTTTSKKKVKRHSSMPDSSESLVSSKTTSNPTSQGGQTTQNPTSQNTTSEGTSEGTSSASVSSASTPTSETSFPSVTTAQPPVSTSVQPSSSSSEQPSSVVPPSSSQEPPSSSQEPPSSSAVPPSSSSEMPVVPSKIGDTDYTDCQAKFNSNDPSGLLTELRNVTKNGYSGTYADLWNTYKSVYIRNDGKIFDYYSNITNYRPGTDQAGNYSEEGDVYNREHSVPKSWFGQDSSHGGVKEHTIGTDPFMVVPTDGYVNGRRSNYTFGMVDSVTYSSANSFSKLGSGLSSFGYTGTVFEPDDSLKGDFARIYFYVIARYADSYSWTAGDGSLNFSNSTSTNFGLTNYAVKLYSYWSNLDPVNDWERQINNDLEPIQGNRNPFIDHPEYANVLWGKNTNYTTYNH